MPADIITYYKNVQAAGFFYDDAALRPAQPYRQFDAWMGDPARALIFGALCREIQRLDLIRNTAETGEYL